jgi:hypothetical protein
MDLIDAKATLAAVAFNATATTVTLRVDLTLADSSPMADAIFGAWQLLRDQARHGTAAKLAEAEVFGTNTFTVSVWGMAEADRARPYASPLMRGDAAVHGAVAATVTPGEGDAPASVRVTVRFRAPHLAWDLWTGQDVGAAYGGPCWVDLYPVQPALPGVEPARRLPRVVGAVVLDGNGGETPLLDAIDAVATARGTTMVAEAARSVRDDIAAEASDRTGCDDRSDDEGAETPSPAATKAALEDRVADYLTRVGDNGRALLSALRASGRLTLAEAAKVLRTSPKGAKDAAATCQRWAPVVGIAWPFERVPESTSVIEWQWTGWQGAQS